TGARSPVEDLQLHSGGTPRCRAPLLYRDHATERGGPDRTAARYGGWQRWRAREPAPDERPGLPCQGIAGARRHRAIWAAPRRALAKQEGAFGEGQQPPDR